MKVYSNEINTLQQHNITYQANIAYRNGDPYIVSSELNNPHIVFSLASSKFVKDKKYYKTWWGEIAGAYPTFYQTTPNVITEDIPEENIPNYFLLNGKDWGKDHSWCVFNLNKDYFYYVRNPIIKQALNNFKGEYVWRTSNNIYYSEYDPSKNIKRHYILDKLNGIWVEKTWNGFDNFSAKNIWGSWHYYCSISSTEHYELDEGNSTWTSKTFTGLDNISFNATNVWEYIDDYYYSNGSVQLILNFQETGWEPKTWEGLENFSVPFFGSYIWVYKGKVHYDAAFTTGNAHLVLNGNTWSPQVWDGIALNQLGRGGIWLYKGKAYYNTAFNSYALGDDDITWVPKTWNIVSFYGGDIWGDNSMGKYYSSGTSQFKLDDTLVWNRATWPATYRDGYTYEKVAYEFMYRKAFDYDTVKEWQGLDYVYDLKIVSGITNYEYLVNLMHSYKLDQNTEDFTVEIDNNSYTFGWVNNQWLFWDSASTAEADGRVPSFEVLSSFAKSNVVLTYLGNEAKDYLEQVRKANFREPITIIDNVDYILHPIAFNVSSVVKGRVCDGHKR